MTRKIQKSEEEGKSRMAKRRTHRWERAESVRTKTFGPNYHDRKLAQLFHSVTQIRKLNSECWYNLSNTLCQQVSTQELSLDSQSKAPFEKIFSVAGWGGWEAHRSNAWRKKQQGKTWCRVGGKMRSVKDKLLWRQWISLEGKLGFLWAGRRM